MLRTSRPCAVTTSGASTSDANSPAGTRKCAQTTSGRAARLHTPPQLEEARACRRRGGRAPRARSRGRARAARARRCATNEPRSGSSGPGYICETSRMRTQCAALARRALAVVLAPLLAQHAADLADRAVRAQRVAHRRRAGSRCRAPPRARARAPPPRRPRSRPARTRRGPLELAALGLGVDRRAARSAAPTPRRTC